MALGESFQFEIGADIRQAQERLDALKQRIGALKGDVAQVDGQEIDLDVDGRQVDDVREAVEDLRQSAGRGIDLNIDPSHNAARAAEDVRRMGVNAEGIQRGIGPLRGFTDELGGAAGAGGIAANAIIDAGEAVEIFGSQLGLSQAALARWSLALGGIGIAVGLAIPLIKALAGGQDDVEKATDAANERLREQTGLLDQIESRIAQQPSIFEALLPEENRDEILRAFSALGFELNQMAPALVAVNNNGRAFAAQRLELAGLAREEADALAKVIDTVNGYDRILTQAKGSTEFVAQNETLIRSLERILELGKNVDEERLLSDFLADVEYGGTQRQIEAVAAAIERIGNASTAEKLAAAFEAFEMAAPSSERVASAAEIIQNEIDRAATNMRRFGADGVEQMGAVQSAAEGVAGTIGELLGRYDLLTGRIGEERQLIAITEQYQRTLEALGRKTEAEATNSADAADAAVDYRKELLSLQQMVVQYGEAFDEIPPEKITRLYTAIDQGDLTRAATLLGELTADRTIRISVDAAGAGPVRFLIDPSTGVPTQVSGARTPTVIAGAPSVPTPPPAFTLDDLERVLSRSGSRSQTNVYTIGVDPVPATRDYEFANGAR